MSSPTPSATDHPSRPRRRDRLRISGATIRFYSFLAIVLLAAAGLLANLWPHARAAAHAQSARLTTAAAQTAGAEAQANYHLATWLDPANQTAYLGLARLQIARGQADAGLISLRRAGQGSEAQQLKVRGLIELGRYNEAANEAASLTTADRPPDDLVLAALALALADRSPDETLMARVGSSEAAQRISRARAATVSLAAELQATGLLESSSALLQKLPSSYERNLLLAQNRYARHTAADLTAAADYLLVAISQHPAGLEARKLLINVYRDNNQADQATAQSALIAKLETGRP